MPTVALVGETIAEEALFSMHATGPSTRQGRTLKHGDSFAVLDSHGDMGAAADVADGLFHCDTRFLSRLELRLNGTAPLLLGSNVSDDNATLNVDLTNPDILIGERLFCRKDTLHIVRTLFVWRGRFYQRLGVRNHGEEEIDFELSFIFASDFADIFEVRGLQRERHGITSIELEAHARSS
jgi:glycogen debranching enzyme